MDMGKIDKVILWGCSISYGLNADKDKIYGQRIADWLGVPLINLSISGAGNIVGSNILLNKPIEFFENALVLFQTTYFERQIDKDIIPNPFYGNRFYKEVNANSFRIDDFRVEFDIKDLRGVAEILRIDEWVGYWTEYENFYNRKYWKYKKDFDKVKWIDYLKELFKQNSYSIYLVHQWFKKNKIQHLFFDIPIPIMGYKLNYKNHIILDSNFFAHTMINFLSGDSDNRNCFYNTFKDENFFFIDEIDEENKITDILIEPIYTGNDTTIWKEFLMPDRPYGTPDPCHPNERGHEKIFEVLKRYIKK